MLKTNIEALERAQKKVIGLEASIRSRLSKELAALPSQFGFESVRSFIRAVKAASSGGPGRPGRPKGPEKKSVPSKRKRMTITPAMREKVKRLAKAGKSGAQIVKAVGISLPSVQNIKKAFGLVRSKAKKTAPARPARKKRSSPKKAVRKAGTAPKATSPAPEAPKAQEASESASQS